MGKIAIIPARGGSKRIPRKNIKDFLGKPIIVYSIEVALNSGLFDEVMVSTEDEEIADIAVRYGAKVPFRRSVRNADDHAILNDVLKEVIDTYQAKGKEFQVGCCILPTSPFLQEDDLLKAYKLMMEKQFDSVRPVVRFSYPIQRAVTINEDGGIMMSNPDMYKVRSQDLEPAFHDAGQFYWFRVPSLLTSKNKGAFEIEAYRVQDIDTEEDWKMAEIKYQVIQAKL